MSFGIPGISEIRNAVSQTIDNAQAAVTHTVTEVRDLGAAAINRTGELASSGVELGRRAVDAVRNVDVREAASTVRSSINSGIETARSGITTGVEWAGQRVHDAADVARASVPGGDNIVSNAVRSAITVQEDASRLSLGVVGGVSREAVGLAGTVGDLATTGVEMQLSPEAAREYGTALVNGASIALHATGDYLASAAQDPSRIIGDLSRVADAGGKLAGDQLDRYQQAFRDGKGFETVGLDVGTVATYVVPIGGGPVRGALTAAVRGSGEALARGGGEALLRGGAETLARGETAALRGEMALRGTGESLVRAGTDTGVAANATGGVIAGAERSTPRLEAGSIREVNPAFPAAGHTQNCVECVIATERRFAGDLSAVASPTSGPLPIRTITDTFGGAFQKVSGPAEIGSILSGSGDGARGIVYGADNARGFGHVWNVRIDDGVVRFLDSQPGAKAGLGVGNFDHFTDFQFLLTHAGK